MVEKPNSTFTLPTRFIFFTFPDNALGSVISNNIMDMEIKALKYRYSHIDELFIHGKVRNAKILISKKDKQ